MTQIVLNVSEEEARRLSQRAQESGYKTIEAYLRALVIDNDNDQEDIAALHADFKEAFKDAVRGKFYTEEEYRRMMAEDD